MSKHPASFRPEDKNMKREESRMELSKSALLCGVGLAACLALHSPAEAQQPGTHAEAGATLGEVIVTARKRQESILNVPVVETALPQEKLERVQVNDLKDMQKLVPRRGV